MNRRDFISSFGTLGALALLPKSAAAVMATEPEVVSASCKLVDYTRSFATGGHPHLSMQASLPYITEHLRMPYLRDFTLVELRVDGKEVAL